MRGAKLLLSLEIEARPQGGRNCERSSLHSYFFRRRPGLRAYFLKPLHIPNPFVDAAAGVLLGLGIVFFEIRLKQVSLKR